VYVELADATPAEAERGMAMLKKLVDEKTDVSTSASASQLRPSA
jgi:hypothetical protein